MIGHLGSRISALLDGQMSAEEEERAWAHVHACHQCRDLVEREGWVKTRLAGLTRDPAGIPDHLTDQLKGRLQGHPLGSPLAPLGSPLGLAPGDAYLAMGVRPDHRGRRAAGLAAIGGGAVGAAVVGVLALGTAPADAPSIDRRPPVTQISTPAAPSSGVPLRTP